MSSKKDLQRAHKALLEKGYVTTDRTFYERITKTEKAIDGVVVIKTTTARAKILIGFDGTVLTEDRGESTYNTPDFATGVPENLVRDSRLVTIAEDEFTLVVKATTTFVFENRIYISGGDYYYTKKSLNQYGHTDYGDWLD